MRVLSGSCTTPSWSSWRAARTEWNGEGAARACDDAEVAYDEGLATRVRDLIGDEPGLVEKKMFGGLAMMLDGNMAVGVHGENLIVRAAPEQYEQLLGEPGARPFDLTGWPMRGWLLVDPAGKTPRTSTFAAGSDRGFAFARSLLAK
jgi:TfoX N-terminal domain